MNFLRFLKYLLKNFTIRNNNQLLWKLIKKGENLIKYHSFLRIINFFHYMSLRIQSHIKKMILDGDIHNGVFYLLLDMKDIKTKKVIKIPRFNNAASCKLLELVSNKQRYDTEYVQFLKNLYKKKYLSKHLPTLYQIKKNGAYVSAYIDGINLKELKRRIINNNCEINKQKLINSILDLLQDIEKYKSEEGKLVGDWGHHNLLYNKESKIIYNVDLEGLAIYNSNCVESSYEYIRYELNSLINLIKISELDRNILNIFKMVENKVSSQKLFSGASFFAGYQSIRIKNYFFNGRKNCELFVTQLPINFNDKIVLDLGSYWGSVLFALSDYISFGYGMDKDDTCIKVSEKLKNQNGIQNIKFYKADIENFDLKILKYFNIPSYFDIIFVLDLLNEIRNPVRLIHNISKLANKVIFELNGSQLLRDKQKQIIKKYFKNITNIDFENESWWFSKNSDILICSN